MKKLIYSLLVVLTVAFCSCKKDSTVPGDGVASITIVNAVPDLSRALLNFTDGKITYSTDRAFVSYGAFKEFGKVAGPLPITVVASTDTLHNLYSGQVNQKERGIYSFYLFGQVSAMQTMFVEDQIPVHRDSVAGVRFVNLSSDSQAFSIVLDGQPLSQPEFAHVPFKQVTSFKSYDANGAALAQGGYNFLIVDSSGNVVTTVFWSISTFNNNTLVISGSAADGSLYVAQVNNY